MNTIESIILLVAVAAIFYAIGKAVGKEDGYHLYNFELENDHTLLNIEYEKLYLDFEDTASELLKMKGHPTMRYERKQQI